MRTFRRLNDPERYYGLTLRGWVGLAVGVGVLYGAVRLSPLAAKPTISITLVLLTLVGGLLLGLSGQAIGPGRLLVAVLRYAATRRQLIAPVRPDRRGFALADPPPVVTSRQVEEDVFEEAGA
jgi:hypothetical protein